MSEMPSAMANFARRFGSNGAWHLLSAAVVVSMLAACTGGDPPDDDVEAGAPEGDVPGVTGATVPADSEFVEAVLADGEVTREEYDQALTRFAQCLLNGGAEGEMWVAPDMGIFSPAVSLGFASGGDDDGSAVDGLHSDCNGSYFGAIEFEISGANPPTPEQESRMFDLASQCLSGRDSDLASQVSGDWDYPSLRQWWADQSIEDQETALTGQDCIVYLGIPFRDLEEW